MCCGRFLPVNIMKYSVCLGGRGKEWTNGAIEKGQIEDDHYKGHNSAIIILVGEDIIEML